MGGSVVMEKVYDFLISNGQNTTLNTQHSNNNVQIKIKHEGSVEYSKT